MADAAVLGGTGSRPSRMWDRERGSVSLLAAALMLRHGLARPDEAARIESAVDRALEAGLRTSDLGGTATTATATEAVLKELT